MLLIPVLSLMLAGALPVGEKAVEKEFAGFETAFVMEALESGKTLRFESKKGGCGVALPPCSTFKIYNTLIGLETGVLTSADQPFYKWDGVKRFIPDWNQDLTLRQAYAVSCVPGYQELARKIGAERMKTWIDRLGYGNRDISSGLDVFWLPAKGRRTILISAEEQLALLRRLVKGELPVSKQSLGVLKEVMLLRETGLGCLYAKTGTGSDENDKRNLGWFVGYVVTTEGKTYLFACNIRGGDTPSGPKARERVERILERSGLL